MASSAKRTRFDASALSPTDKAITPMSSARQSLAASCVSLQPEIATILSKLGLETIQNLQKLSHKQRQVKKIEDEVDFVPRSARVKFTLTTSKLVEEDAEYIRLRDETSTLVDNFQTALKNSILKLAKLETSLLKKKVADDFAISLRLSVEACLIIESDPALPNADRIVVTLLSEYSTKLLEHLGITLPDFKTVYKRMHTLASLPAPLTLRVDIDAPPRLVEALPPQPTLHALSKIQRTLETTFLDPWSIYIDVQHRNDITLRLKKLGTEHFTTAATEDANMVLDDEEPVAARLMKDLIKDQVATHTKALRKEVETLRAQVAKKSPLNTPRGLAGAAQKKTVRVVAKPKGSADDKNGTAKSSKKSRPRSRSKPSATNRH
jgi:hypothetical protein